MENINRNKVDDYDAYQKLAYIEAYVNDPEKYLKDVVDACITSLRKDFNNVIYAIVRSRFCPGENSPVR